MTVKDLITKLLEFDMKEEPLISLDNERAADIVNIENWHERPIIHFTDRREDNGN